MYSLFTEVFRGKSELFRVEGICLELCMTQYAAKHNKYCYVLQQNDHLPSGGNPLT